MTTAQTLITDAWVDAGVGGIADTPTAGDLAFYLRRLNRMLESWSTQGLVVYEVYDVTINTVAGTASYASTGLSGGLRPIAVSHARVTASNVDYPLEIIGTRDYAMIAAKTERGLPLYLYVQPTMPNATMYLWPVPDAVYALKLGVTRPFTSSYVLGDTVSLPPGYEKAIVDNLAVDIATVNGVDPHPRLMQQANESMAVLKAMQVQPHLLDNSIGFDAVNASILYDE